MAARFHGKLYRATYCLIYTKFSWLSELYSTPLNIFNVARLPLLGILRAQLQFRMIPPCFARAFLAKVVVGGPAGLFVIVSVMTLDGTPCSAHGARHGELLHDFLDVLHDFRHGPGEEH